MLCCPNLLDDQIPNEIALIDSLPIALKPIFGLFDPELAKAVLPVEFPKKMHRHSTYRNNLRKFCFEQIKKYFSNVVTNLKPGANPDWIRIYINEYNFLYNLVKCPTDLIFKALCRNDEAIGLLPENPTRDRLYAIVFTLKKHLTIELKTDEANRIIFEALPLLVLKGDLIGIQNILSNYHSTSNYFDQFKMALTRAWLVAIQRGESVIAACLTNHIKDIDATKVLLLTENLAEANNKSIIYNFKPVAMSSEWQFIAVSDKEASKRKVTHDRLQ